MNFIDFQKKFKTEKHIIQHFISIRYNDQVKCNHCGSDKVHQRPTRLRIFQCNGCNKDFSIFKGTIFQGSQTKLLKWFYAIHLFINGKKGISGLQLQRELSVTYKTAWRMLKQIRTAMDSGILADTFDGTVEADETYMGGKPRKGPNGKFDLVTTKRGRGTSKIPVIGVKDREKKLIHAKVALPDCDGHKLTGKQLLAVLKEVTKVGTTVMTDEFRSYNVLSRNGFIHMRIDHNKTFANGPIHTNGLESFWSTLKRGVYGVYHSVSLKYLQQYVNEFCFRYNNRNNPKMFDLLLTKSINA